MRQVPTALVCIGRRALRLATLAYAIYLLLGALAVIAWVVYREIWAGLAHGLFFLFCAALFSWGQRHTQEPPGPSGHRRARGSRKPAWSLRQWSLLMTGIGAGISLAMVLLQVVVYYDAGVAIGPGLVFAFALPLAGAGVIVFFVDVIDHRGEHRRSGAPP